MNGRPRNNLWWVRTADPLEDPIRYHSLADLDPTSFPNDTVINYANDLFVSQQDSGRLDGNINDAALDELVRNAYYEIFGINPEAYLTPDANIPPENR